MKKKFPQLVIILLLLFTACNNEQKTSPASDQPATVGPAENKVNVPMEQNAAVEQVTDGGTVIKPADSSGSRKKSIFFKKNLRLSGDSIMKLKQASR